MAEFNEYEFLNWCGERYLEGLSQEEAHLLQKMDRVQETIKALPPYDLIIFLGAYLSRETTNEQPKEENIEPKSKPRVTIQFLLEISRPTIGFTSCFEVSPIAAVIVNSGFLQEDQPIISVSRILPALLTQPIKYSGVVYLVNVKLEEAVDEDGGRSALEIYQEIVRASVDRGIRHNHGAIEPFEYKVSNIEEVRP